MGIQERAVEETWETVCLGWWKMDLSHAELEWEKLHPSFRVTEPLLTKHSGNV